MQQPQVDRYDWRRAYQFDPWVVLTIVIGIAVATLLTGLA